jgi:hypothetical protein
MKIGNLRRKLFKSFDCAWNGYVRDVTAKYEGPNEDVPEDAVIHAIIGKCAELINIKGFKECMFPTIVCLCGSTRFKDAFDEANYQETMAGRIVLSVGFMMHATGNRHGEDVGATPQQKLELDELHKRKIDLADEVLILNVGGYIGSSTRSELNYAIKNGKPVRYLESVPKVVTGEMVDENDIEESNL